MKRLDVTLDGRSAVPTGILVRAARGLLNWSIGDLARTSGLHRNTIAALELGNRKVESDTVETIVATLQTHGVDLVREDDEVIGVKMRLPKSRISHDSSLASAGK